MDILDITSDTPSYDTSWLFPQPLSVCQRDSSGMVFSAKAEPNPERLCWFKRGDNHLQVYRAQCLLNRYIGGYFGPEWLTSGGMRWPFLLEDGMLRLDTELALKEFQQRWSLPSSGCLCPKTRLVLPPLLRFRGSLLRKRLKCPPLRWSGGYQGGSGPRYGSSGSSSSSPQPGKTPDPTPKPPVPKPTPTGNAVSDDDDDKPWTLQFTPNLGVGGAVPMWTGRSGTGAKLMPDKLELDQKTEFDLSLITGWALGDGKVKLTLGAEYDAPFDKDHRGTSLGSTLGDKSTVAGNIQVQADDLWKNDYVSIAPFLKYSAQLKGGKESNQLKGGVEFDLDLHKTLGLPKGTKLEADVNAGIQTPGPGNDRATTPSLIAPIEGNVNFTWDFDLFTFGQGDKKKDR